MAEEERAGWANRTGPNAVGEQARLNSPASHRNHNKPDKGCLLKWREPRLCMCANSPRPQGEGRVPHQSISEPASNVHVNTHTHTWRKQIRQKLMSSCSFFEEVNRAEAFQALVKVS